MRNLLAVLLLLAFTSSASAEPNWFHRHKRGIALFAVNGAAIGVDAVGLKHCRQGDVENCTAHYGSAWGTFGIWAGVTGIVFPVLAEQCWKDGNNKLCYFIGYTPAAYQFAWGINEYKQYGPKEADDTSSKSIQSQMRPVWFHLKESSHQ